MATCAAPYLHAPSHSIATGACFNAKETRLNQGSMQHVRVRRSSGASKQAARCRTGSIQHIPHADKCPEDDTQAA